MKDNGEHTTVGEQNGTVTVTLHPTATQRFATQQTWWKDILIE